MLPLPDREELLQEWAQWLRYRGFKDSIGESMAEQIVEFIYTHESLIVPQELTAQQKSDARDIFEGKVSDRQACHHCAGLHPQVAGLQPEQQPCPRIKRIKRHTDGTTTLDVEYWPNGEWEADVVFPGDVYDEED